MSAVFITVTFLAICKRLSSPLSLNKSDLKLYTGRTQTRAAVNLYLSKSKVEVKCHRNVITLRTKITQIPNKLHHFLLSRVFSFARTDTQTYKEKQYLLRSLA